MPEQTAVERTFAEAKAEQAALPIHDPHRVQKRVLVWLLALAIMYTLYFAQDVLLPVFLAFLFGLLLRPPVKWLRRVRLPEPAGALLVVVLTLVLLGWGVSTVSGPAIDWVERLPQLTGELKAKLGGLESSLRQAREATETLQDAAGDGSGTPSVVVRGPSLADTLLTGTQLLVTQGLVTVILTFFILAFGRQTLESVIRSLPRVHDRLLLADIVNTVQINISAYLLTVTLINVGLGLVLSGLFWMLGLPNPLLFGLLAGLLNFVPILGPAIMAGVLLVVGLLSYPTWWQIAAPAAVHLLVHGIESNLVTPAIIGRRLSLNPIFVFATVLFWGWLWGVPGALLAVPILAVFKILCDATPQLRTVGALIGG